MSRTQVKKKMQYMQVHAVHAVHAVHVVADAADGTDAVHAVHVNLAKTIQHSTYGVVFPFKHIAHGGTGSVGRIPIMQFMAEPNQPKLSSVFPTFQGRGLNGRFPKQVQHVFVVGHVGGQGT
jgi:hypothetical protein